MTDLAGSTTRPIPGQASASPAAHHDPTRPLRRVLALNAGATAATALLLVAAAGPLDEVLDTGRVGVVRIVGLALAVFALDVGLAARAGARTLRRAAVAITVADVAWVVASVATVVAGWYATAGAALVLLVAAVVGAFVVLEGLAARRIDGA